jgi:hypothetical protein
MIALLDEAALDDLGPLPTFVSLKGEDGPCPSGDITGGFASRRHWVGSGSSPCTSLVKGRRTGKTGGKSPRPRNGPPKPSPG